MADYVQISAQISEAARARLDQYARETGLKKSRIVEDAIESYLDTRDEIPPEYLMPARLVLDDASWERLVERIENPGEPTPELIELLRPHREEFRRLLGLDD
jgi:uncharacterized protein (DUF1778 family)